MNIASAAISAKSGLEYDKQDAACELVASKKSLIIDSSIRYSAFWVRGRRTNIGRLRSWLSLLSVWVR